MRGFRRWGWGCVFGLLLGAAGCEQDECFSPTQNAGHAYESGAKGCVCDAKRDEAVCVSGASLLCKDDHWTALQDGVCSPHTGFDAGSPPVDASIACFSPTQNTSHAYESGAVGCDCEPKHDHAVCVSGVALICQIHRWIAVEDGPCEPQSHDDAGSEDDAGNSGEDAGH